MSCGPLISIVLPTHNGARFLSSSIQSCVEQTYQHWELILVDDASSDQTPAIISDWVARDGRIRSVRNAVNRKLPGSLNVGFAQARGDFFTWTSDDNLFLPSTLQELAEILQKRRNVDLVYADELDVDAQGLVTALKAKEKPERLIYHNCIRACFLYRASVAKCLGAYDEARFLVEDYDYWLRAYIKGFHFFHLAKPLYKYRFHGDSLTTTRSLDVLKACLALRSKAVPQIGGLPLRERLQIYLDLASLAWDLGSRDLLRQNIFRAVFHGPWILGRRQVWCYLFYALLNPSTSNWVSHGLVRLGLLAQSHRPPFRKGLL